MSPDEATMRAGTWLCTLLVEGSSPTVQADDDSFASWSVPSVRLSVSLLVYLSSTFLSTMLLEENAAENSYHLKRKMGINQQTFKCFHATL